jgi:hypothetical protein
VLPANELVGRKRELAGVYATQTDDAAAALLHSKDESRISGGERFRSDDPEDARSILEEPEIFPVMVLELGAVSFIVKAAFPADLETCRQLQSVTLQLFRLSGDRDLGRVPVLIDIGEEVERPPWRLESEAVRWPSVANREHADGRDLEEALLAELALSRRSGLGTLLEDPLRPGASSPEAAVAEFDDALYLSRSGTSARGRASERTSPEA